MNNLVGHILLNKMFLFGRMATAVAEVLNELKKIPGWDRFPLPECVYKQFNIPKPKPYEGIMDYCKDAFESAFMGTDGCYLLETRPPVEGGLRPVPEAPKLEIEVVSNQKTLGDHQHQATDGEACLERQTQSEAVTQCSASSGEHQP